MDLFNIPNDALFQEVKRRYECSFKPLRRIILVGAPGSGKGTQGPNLADEYCWCHLATGDMLRAAVKAGTEQGLRAKEAMDSGKLVTDDIVIGIVKDAINTPACQYGAILDGFPRNVTQAEELDKILGAEAKIDKVVEFKIPDEKLTERICGRRIHQASGRSYHVTFNPPKVPDVDDVTGEPLIQRPDDNEEVLKTRLQAYHDQTEPICDYYRNRGIYFGLNADQPIKNVWSELNESFSIN